MNAVNERVVTSAAIIKETASALLLSAPCGAPVWWPKSEIKVIRRSFTPAAGKQIVFDAPRWLINAKYA